MILDTSFLIDFLEGLPEAITKMQEMQNNPETIFISAPTIFELWTRVSQSNQPDKEKEKVKKIIDSQHILELTKSCAEEAGLINGTLWKEGKPIDPEDCMIAGIAKYYDETILTRNVKHFNRIKSLKIESY